MIDIELLKEHPELAKSLKLEVTASDLLEFGESIQRRASEASKPKEIEEYLTPAQLTEALHISLVTLWAWDKKGITHPLRVGNRKLYRRSDLEKILQAE